jgi:hypothetical protein
MRERLAARLGAIEGSLELDDFDLPRRVTADLAKHHMRHLADQLGMSGKLGQELSAIDAMSQLCTRRYGRLRGVKHAWGAPIPEGASQLGRGRSDGFSSEIGGHRARRRGNSGYSGEESR